MGLFLSLIFIIGLQYFLIFLFQLIPYNFPPYVVEVTIDLVLAFVFAIFNYRGNKKEAFKDPLFHRSVAIYFCILILFSVIFWLL